MSTGAPVCSPVLPCVGDKPNGVVSTTTFRHNVLGASGQTDAKGVVTEFVRDPSGRVLAQRQVNGAYALLTDGLGSVVGVADAGGEIVASYEYGPFGELVGADGLVAVTPWRFAGAYLDGTGLYKMGERYYDPVLGRWTQQDPVTSLLDPKLWNRYVYAGDDPVNFVDPSGLAPWDWVKDAWSCFTDNVKFAGVVLLSLAGGGETVEAISLGLREAIAGGALGVTATAVTGALALLGVTALIVRAKDDLCD